MSSCRQSKRFEFLCQLETGHLPKPTLHTTDSFFLTLKLSHLYWYLHKKHTVKVKALNQQCTWIQILTAPVMTQCFLAMNLATLTGRSHSSNVFTIVYTEKSPMLSDYITIKDIKSTDEGRWKDWLFHVTTQWAIRGEIKQLCTNVQRWIVTCVSWFQTTTVPL